MNTQTALAVILNSLCCHPDLPLLPS